MSECQRPLLCRDCARCGSPQTRRRFIQQFGGLAAGACVVGPSLLASGLTTGRRPGKIKVGLILVCAPRDWNVWPYVNFDYETRKQEILSLLKGGCPELEFIPMSVEGDPAEETARVTALAEQVDGLLVVCLCTNWGLTDVLLPAVGQLAKPALFVDELYAGSGVFLCHGSKTLRQGSRVVMVSSSDFQDVIDVTRLFGMLSNSSVTARDFLHVAGRTRRNNFAARADLPCIEDPIAPADVKEVISRLAQTTIVRVISRKGDPYKALGATVVPVSFDEINAAYRNVDQDAAAAIAETWMDEAAGIREPSRDDVVNAGAIYLAMRDIVRQYGAQGITMDCLGGFYSGKLPGYPCLGYRQMNDDGVVSGTCEAQIPDMLAMLISRYMFGRASFASDPVLDTSTNRIIYAHCVAPTKMLGADGPSNPFIIRSHAEDGKGAAVQSLLPAGYMTTSFRFTWDNKAMAIHQAKAVDNIDEAKACRTKLAAEVKGDIGKLFLEWDRFGWHRLTVYGDVQEPLEELAKAFGMEIVRET
ncbi:hypothetical protein JXO52_14910 [bacterium]|nr:hypothetical protein [bacterium]